MRVGWIADAHEPVGGAELTAAELKVAAPQGFDWFGDTPKPAVTEAKPDAPKGIEIVECAPGESAEVDVWVVNNCVAYPAETIEALEGRPVFRWWHDLDPHSDPALRSWLLENATHIFCSPLHRKRFPWPLDGEWPIIPPPVDLARFRPTRQMKRHTERVGTCWVGSMQPGKGVQAAGEYAKAEGISIDFYGDGPMRPGETPYTRYCGVLPYAMVPEALASYERFVFLPTAVEPFGRAAIEAKVAGCELVLNNLVGAKHYLDRLDEVEGAAETFWDLVAA